MKFTFLANIFVFFIFLPFSAMSQPKLRNYHLPKETVSECMLTELEEKVHEYLIDTVLSVEDVDFDGDIDRVDYTLVFKTLWDKSENPFDCEIVNDREQDTNADHLLIRVRKDHHSDWNYIEADASKSYITQNLKVPEKIKFEDFGYKFSTPKNSETNYWLSTIQADKIENRSMPLSLNKISRETTTMQDVKLTVEKEMHTLFLTNDFADLRTKLATKNFAPPVGADLFPNPDLASAVRKKMSQVGANWAVDFENGTLTYYTIEEGPFLVHLEDLKSRIGGNFEVGGKSYDYFSTFEGNKTKKEFNLLAWKAIREFKNSLPQKDKCQPLEKLSKQERESIFRALENFTISDGDEFCVGIKSETEALIVICRIFTTEKGKDFSFVGFRENF